MEVGISGCKQSKFNSNSGWKLVVSKGTSGFTDGFEVLPGAVRWSLVCSPVAQLWVHGGFTGGCGATTLDTILMRRISEKTVICFDSKILLR